MGITVPVMYDDSSDKSNATILAISFDPAILPKGTLAEYCSTNFGSCDA